MSRHAATILVIALTACAPDATDAGDDAAAPACELEAADQVDYLTALRCPGDFAALAGAPQDAAISGARSVKTVIDRVDDDALYFQHAGAWPTHWPFARAHLSGGGLPPVAPQADFNATEYTSPQRRFLLGAVTFYAEPAAWVYEVAPWDTADAALIATAFRRVRDAVWFGADLRFHPTSSALQHVASALPADVPVITTRALFDRITYQPLNLGAAIGRLRFASAADLSEGALHFRDVVVLDHVPADLPPVAGVITAVHQTPLSHVNVLSQSRGTPNMALTGALTEPLLRDLDGRWVELTVGAGAWRVREVSQADADAWWQAHKPAPTPIPAADTGVTGPRAIDAVLAGEAPLATALPAAIGAFGGKASHYAALRQIGPPVPVPDAFAVPMAHYFAHLAAHGLDLVIAATLADPAFQADPTERAARLASLRAQIVAAPLDPSLAEAVRATMAEGFPTTPMRFRSSTNAEDLDGFTGAGLYTSETGDLHDPDHPIDHAIKTVWASAWGYAAFEERAYRSIPHEAVGMAILVSPAHRDEVANGVAVTANLFDATGAEPAFVVNVQRGALPVVAPPPGVQSDWFIYYWYHPGQPATFLTHSNLGQTGEDVLTAAQAHRLGQALDAIHAHFLPVYGAVPGRFYGMDVELKLGRADGRTGEPPLIIKQARPHPGWGLPQRR